MLWAAFSRETLFTNTYIKLFRQNQNQRNAVVVQADRKHHQDFT